MPMARSVQSFHTQGLGTYRMAGLRQRTYDSLDIQPVFTGVAPRPEM